MLLKNFIFILSLLHSVKLRRENSDGNIVFRGTSLHQKQQKAPERNLMLTKFERPPIIQDRRLKHKFTPIKIKEEIFKIEKHDVNKEIKEEKSVTSNLKKQIGGLERTLRDMKKDLKSNEHKMKKMTQLNDQNEEMKASQKGKLSF